MYYRVILKMDASSNHDDCLDTYLTDDETDKESEDGDSESGLECEDLDLSISSRLAQANLKASGSLVPEDTDQITIEKNMHLMTDEVTDLLEKTLDEVKPPYQLAEFQQVAINVLGQMKNLILVSPTGSGKMTVPLLAVLVLRLKLDNPKGVAIVTQPLTSIMKDKLINCICPVAILSMKGDLTTGTNDNDSEDVTLSCDLDRLLDGEFPVIFGHSESFDSKLGQFILRELKKRERQGYIKNYTVIIRICFIKI